MARSQSCSASRNLREPTNVNSSRRRSSPEKSNRNNKRRPRVRVQIVTASVANVRLPMPNQLMARVPGNELTAGPKRHSFPMVSLVMGNAAEAAAADNRALREPFEDGSE